MLGKHLWQKRLQNNWFVDIDLIEFLHLNIFFFQQAVPVYEHMFSDLRQYPRFAYRIQSKDSVPVHVNRQWLGQADAHREQVALSRL